MILAMNTQTSGIAEWDLNWAGVGALGNRIYGITPTSLDMLELLPLDVGDELGFHALIQTGLLELGRLADVNVPRVYLEYTAFAPATLVTQTRNRGAETALPYQVGVRSPSGVDDQTMRPLRLARGPRGAWWAFEFSGPVWKIDAFQILVDKISKHS